MQTVRPPTARHFQNIFDMGSKKPTPKNAISFKIAQFPAAMEPGLFLV